MGAIGRPKVSELRADVTVHLRRFGPCTVRQLAAVVGASVHAVNKELVRNEDRYEIDRYEGVAPVWRLVRQLVPGE